MFYIKLTLMFLWAFLATFICFPLLPITIPSGWAFSLWIRLVAFGALNIAGYKVTMRDHHYLSAVRPCVIMGNHQSALDIISFGKFSPHKCFGIGKVEISWIPIIGWYFWLAGGILLNRKKTRDAIGVLKSAASRLHDEKIAVAIMPEGTRNPSGNGLLPFKKGAFHLAIKAQADICIIISSPIEEIASFSKKTIRRGHIETVALPPISVQGKTEKDIDSLMQEVREKMLAALKTVRTTPR